MEKFIDGRHACDDVERLVIDRLAKRQEKLDRIAQWESAAKYRVRALYAAISAAACIAIVFVAGDLLGGSGCSGVIDELGIQAPRMEVFRSAAPEFMVVENYMADGEYYKALDVAAAALKKSDKTVKNYEKEPCWGDEEWEYEYKYERLMNSEMRWAYIYLLVVADSEKSAVKELKKYLEDVDYCQHRSEAESMLRAFS